MELLFPLVILTIALVVTFGRSWEANKYRKLAEGENPLDLPPIKEIFENTRALRLLREEAVNVGFIHTAETRTSGAGSTSRNIIYISELFISRVDGQTQTLARRSRRTDAPDLEGERMAQRLADDLGIECRIM